MFRFNFDRTTGWGRHVDVFQVIIPGNEAEAKKVAEYLAQRLTTKDEAFQAKFVGRV